MRPLKKAAPIIVHMTDPDGRPLVSCRIHDPLRHKPVWAVYKIQSDSTSAEARNSDFVVLAEARTIVDELNRTRVPGETHYFTIYRLAYPVLPADQDV
jgi:hypothetical protein